MRKHYSQNVLTTNEVPIEDLRPKRFFLYRDKTYLRIHQLSECDDNCVCLQDAVTMHLHVDALVKPLQPMLLTYQEMF